MGDPMFQLGPQNHTVNERNPANQVTSWQVVFSTIYKVLYIPGGWPDFWTINSTIIISIATRPDGFFFCNVVGEFGTKNGGFNSQEVWPLNFWSLYTGLFSMTCPQIPKNPFTRSDRRIFRASIPSKKSI